MDDESRKKELTKHFMSVELVPDDVRSSIILSEATEMSFDSLMIMGGSFAIAATAILENIEMVSSFNSVTKEAPKLFRAFDANGNPLNSLPYAFKDGSGSVATIHDNLGNIHQARLVPAETVAASSSPSLISPDVIAAIMVAVVLQGINNKLNKIQETQQNILDFLQEDKRALLKANIDFLMDILSNYKHNWNNEMYKTNMHVKVLDIRQSAEQNIEFYRRQIAKQLEINGHIMSDKKAKNKLCKVQSNLEDYRTALNLFSFASYTEILLLENYSSEYLDGVSKKIRKYSLQYRELYSECYGVIKENIRASIKSKAVKGVAAVSKFTGKTIEKIPLVRRGQLDENLIEAHSRLNKYNDDRPDMVMKRLTVCKDISANKFADYIDSINMLFNHPTQIYFDYKKIYLLPANIQKIKA